MSTETSEDKRPNWEDWRAVIAPTDSGDTFGIWWQHAPAMERRGGYSGPYNNRGLAEQGAINWLEHWGVTEFVIVHQDVNPD